MALESMGAVTRIGQGPDALYAASIQCMAAQFPVSYPKGEVIPILHGLLTSSVKWDTKYVSPAVMPASCRAEQGCTACSVADQSAARGFLLVALMGSCSHALCMLKCQHCPAGSPAGGSDLQLQQSGPAVYESVAAQQGDEQTSAIVHVSKSTVNVKIPLLCIDQGGQKRRLPTQGQRETRSRKGGA